VREEANLYQAVGGIETFRRLVSDFYDRLDGDPCLRPLFVEATLDGPKERLALFLAQYFGGPPNYSLSRGHPRLRARHLPFVIGRRERDAWVGHMLAALDASGITEPYRSAMRAYFEDTATFLMNSDETAADGSIRLV
jgi:hemoglobin